MEFEKRNSFKISPGDKVAVIAPAGKGSQTNLELIKTYVESLELVPVISTNIYDPDTPFYSNSDEFRASDLIAALKDEEIKLIWCIRGGTGCIRLISFLNAELPETGLPQKLLVGFSDITVLHLYLEEKYDWQTIHGPMLESIVNGSYDPEGEPVLSLLDLFFERIQTTTLPTLTRLDENGDLDFGIQGKIIGGNLTLVEASIGTAWEVQPAGKVLFLEETGEAAYRLERSLDHIKQTTILDSILSIIFGDFTPSDDPGLVDLVLSRFAKSVSFPVFRLTGIGHGSVNHPLPLNTNAEITLIDPEQALYSCTVANVSFRENRPT
jgi:muramoyltetrapeptide carboxypeptidase